VPAPHVGTWFATCTYEEFFMPQSFSFQAPQPPQLEPQWSTWIVIIAVLFLIAVFAFYFYVH
jgi:hypothetical protein